MSGSRIAGTLSGMVAYPFSITESRVHNPHFRPRQASSLSFCISGVAAFPVGSAQYWRSRVLRPAVHF